MKESYIFEYLDEQKFKKCERSVKKYNMFAFKKLVFDFSVFNEVLRRPAMKSQA